MSHVGGLVWIIVDLGRRPTNYYYYYYYYYYSSFGVCVATTFAAVFVSSGLRLAVPTCLSVQAYAWPWQLAAVHGGFASAY